jgi:hypothetical protein
MTSNEQSQKESEIILVHKYSSKHKQKIMTSGSCGCFHCLQIFAPTKITDWVDWPEGTPPNDQVKLGTTALCPLCGIDSVIGDTSGYSISTEFLSKMQRHWFGECE